MIRSILTSLFAIFIMVSASGQDLKQQVISSSGGYDVSGDNSISLSWTLGELVITTVESVSGDLILTQGFQQSKMSVTAIGENKDLGVKVSIYPNPTSEIVNIKFASPLDGETYIFIIAPDGKQIFNEKISYGQLLKQINMQEFPAGTYYIRVQNEIKLNVYKVIKL